MLMVSMLAFMGLSMAVDPLLFMVVLLIVKLLVVPLSTRIP